MLSDIWPARFACQARKFPGISLEPPSKLGCKILQGVAPPLTVGVVLLQTSVSQDRRGEPGPQTEGRYAVGQATGARLPAAEDRSVPYRLVPAKQTPARCLRAQRMRSRTRWREHRLAVFLF